MKYEWVDGVICVYDLEPPCPCWHTPCCNECAHWSTGQDFFLFLFPLCSILWSILIFVEWMNSLIPVWMKWIDLEKRGHKVEVVGLPIETQNMLKRIHPHASVFFVDTTTGWFGWLGFYCMPLVVALLDVFYLPFCIFWWMLVNRTSAWVSFFMSCVCYFHCFADSCVWFHLELCSLLHVCRCFYFSSRVAFFGHKADHDGAQLPWCRFLFVEYLLCVTRLVIGYFLEWRTCFDHDRSCGSYLLRRFVRLHTCDWLSYGWNWPIVCVLRIVVIAQQQQQSLSPSLARHATASVMSKYLRVPIIPSSTT